jgi:VCBS repeat-containing protein
VIINSDGTYTYDPNIDYTGADSFTFKVNDGTVDSDPATVNVTVTSDINTPPVATPVDAITTPKNTSKSGTLTGTDADGDTLTFSKVADPTSGTVIINSDGTYTYDPNIDYTGADSFTFKVNDGTVDSAPATVSITVTTVACNAYAMFSVPSGILPLTVTFITSSTVGTLSFDYGDGKSGDSATHTYDNPGTYKVYLTATVSDTCTEQRDITITVTSGGGCTGYRPGKYEYGDDTPADIFDALAVAMYSVKMEIGDMESPWEIINNDSCLKAALDVDGNPGLDINDALAIAKRDVGLFCSTGTLHCVLDEVK